METVTKPGFQFCRSTDCDVVYFHPAGECLRKPDVRGRVGLKETEDPVPVCYCFGFSVAMVREEIRAPGLCTIPKRSDDFGFRPRVSGARRPGISVSGHERRPVHQDKTLRRQDGLDEKSFGEMAGKLFATFGDRLEKSPVALPQMMVALDFQPAKPKQIVISGKTDAPEHARRKSYGFRL